MRSCTVTTRAARLVGGTTKFEPWTTSTGPTNHSTGGSELCRQARCSGRAGMARWAVDTPAGTNEAIPWRRRQLTANADTATGGPGGPGRRDSPDSPDRAPAQKAPTPVGRPRRGVASKATDSRPWSEGADRSGTQRALHTAGAGQDKPGGTGGWGWCRPGWLGDRPASDEPVKSH